MEPVSSLWAEWWPAQLTRLAQGLTTYNTTSKGMAHNLQNNQNKKKDG
jgi:hypothetical protein